MSEGSQIYHIRAVELTTAEAYQVRVDAQRERVGTYTRGAEPGERVTFEINADPSLLQESIDRMRQHCKDFTPDESTGWSTGRDPRHGSLHRGLQGRLHATPTSGGPDG
jgi:hypothetical protein